MPVIIPTDNYGAWLDPASQDIDKLKTFIHPFPTDQMTAHAVSTRVSNARNEGEELVEAVNT